MSHISILTKLIHKDLYNAETLNDLMQLKKPIESLLEHINCKIRESCNHEWESDYIENPYTEELTRIKYCIHCELSK